MADLPRAQAEVLIAMSKYVGSDLHLQPRRNHAGYTSASARPDDMFGATIPGLTVELELKAPSLIDACKNIASIYLSRHGVKYRVYQLEVQPAAKRSHNEPGNTLYGPHQHIGDCALEYDHSKVSCSTPIDDFFRLFCAEANITFTGKIVLP